MKGYETDIQVQGSSYEQGLEHGKQAAQLIAKNVCLLKKQISSFHIGSSDYYELVHRNLNFMKSAEPGLVAEMEGIADGSGCLFFDIVLINLPLYFVTKWLPQECSSILARGCATLDGKTYLVKNRDMVNKVEHIVLNRQYHDGTKIAEVNAAGTVTYPGNGINSYGLAVSTSGVWSKKMKFDLNNVDKAHTLLNTHLLLARCKTVEDAVNYLKHDKRMTGMNFIIADHQQALAAEVTEDNVYVTAAEQDILVRTNHYVVPQLSGLNRTASEYSSTYRRYERAKNFLHEKYGQIRFQDILEIAADHENGLQDSLCRHAKVFSESTTLYSSIMVLEDARMWTVLKNPCQAFNISCF